MDIRMWGMLHKDTFSCIQATRVHVLLKPQSLAVEGSQMTSCALFCGQTMSVMRLCRNVVKDSDLAECKQYYTCTSYHSIATGSCTESWLLYLWQVNKQDTMTARLDIMTDTVKPVSAWLTTVSVPNESLQFTIVLWLQPVIVVVRTGVPEMTNVM